MAQALSQTYSTYIAQVVAADFASRHPDLVVVLAEASDSELAEFLRHLSASIECKVLLARTEAVR